MPLAEKTKSRLLDDACAMIEDMGGVGGLIDDLDEFHELRARMIKEHSRLIEKYPGKWVAMGKGWRVGGGGVEERSIRRNRDPGNSQVIRRGRVHGHRPG